ncbi:hypothetical protein ACLOAV_006585 [Pseudogymnoascus australis]
MATYPKSAVLSLDDTALDILLFSVYPEIFDSSYDYADHFKRVASIVGEGYFSWNMRYLEAAFGEKSYSYLFELTVNATVSKALQSYITHFVATGNPNGRAAPYVPQYGSNSSVQVVVLDDFGSQILRIIRAVHGGSQRPCMMTEKCKFKQRS